MVEIYVGFLGGILIGATGAGGVLVTPLLVLAGGYRPGVAIATGLGALVASRFVGALVHHRLGHWPGRATCVLLLGGASGVPLAWWMLRGWVGAGDTAGELWLRRLLGLALLAAAAGLLLANRNRHNRPLMSGGRSPALLFLVGAGTAVPLTLTSVGAGSLLVPTLALVTDWGAPQLVAASNVFGGAVGVLSLAAQAGFGLFDWVLCAKVLLGLLPGVGLGVLLSRRIPRLWLVYGLGCASIYLATRLFFG